MNKKKTRAYDASGRRRRAAESRERALQVAKRLFAECGYAETTLEAIAREAGISLPTLYSAFESKRGLLDALMQRLVSGEPGARPLLETSGARAVLEERDPRRLLARFVESLEGVQERVVPSYEMLKSAARAEPDLVPLLARVQEQRYRNMAAVADRLVQLHPLRHGMSAEDAARTIWAIASPEVRQMLLTSAGWSALRYRTWLERTLADALL